MFSKFTTISPQEATLWLDTKNSRNRPEIEGLPKKLMADLLAL